jgi:hypothetical protein
MNGGIEGRQSVTVAPSPSQSVLAAAGPADVAPDMTARKITSTKMQALPAQTMRAT